MPDPHIAIAARGSQWCRHALQQRDLGKFSKEVRRLSELVRKRGHDHQNDQAREVTTWRARCPMRKGQRLLPSRRSGGVDELEASAPVSVIGTGPDLNSATDNGLQRAADLLGMTVPEVKNRATLTGAIEIGRHPGVVQVTFRAPLERLEAKGLAPFVRDQYDIG